MNHSLPNAASNASGGMARKNDARRSGWRGRPSTPASASMKSRTSTRGGDHRSGRPNVSKSSGSGASSPGSSPRLGRRQHRPLDVVAVHRGLEHARRAGQLGGPHADPVHLDVVGVAVAAVVVVDREHVGLLVAEDRGQPLGGLVDVGLPERPSGVVLGRAHHPGVDVAEELDPLDAEDLGRRARSPARAARQSVSPSSRKPSCDLAVLAPGGEHEDDAVPVGGRLGHRAAGGDRLVVGVGVEGDERRHAAEATDAPTRWRRPRGAWRRGRRRSPTRRAPRRCAGRRGPAGRCTAPGVRRSAAPAPAARRRRARRTCRARTLCGCCGASASDSTGAKHTSVPSMISHHSSRVFVLKISAQPLLQRRPLAAVVLPGQLLALEAGEAEQLGVELRLDRADRHVLAVGGLVHVVEVGAGVEQVRAALVAPDAHGGHGVEHRHQHGGAVDHRGVDHLALAGRAGRRAGRTPCRRRGTCRRRRSRRPG